MNLRNNGRRCACKGCTSREIGCHATCSKYTQWTEKNERRKRSERMKNEIDLAVREGIVRCGGKKFDIQK